MFQLDSISLWHRPGQPAERVQRASPENAPPTARLRLEVPRHDASVRGGLAHGARFGVRLLLVTMFLAVWVGPTRYVYFTPMYVDPLFFVFPMIGLLLVLNRLSRLPLSGHGGLARRRLFTRGEVSEAGRRRARAAAE